MKNSVKTALFVSPVVRPPWSAREVFASSLARARAAPTHAQHRQGTQTGQVVLRVALLNGLLFIVGREGER